MFKERFNKLCAEKGLSPNAVCSLVGLSNSAYSKWTENSIPRATVLIKLSEFFGVSVAYLKGEEDKTEPATITLSVGDLSPQEQTLVKLFRETTEEGRLEMISAFMNIRNKENGIHTIYRGTSSSEHEEHHIEKRTASDMDRLKNAPTVTSEEDL